MRSGRSMRDQCVKSTRDAALEANCPMNDHILRMTAMSRHSFCMPTIILGYSILLAGAFQLGYIRGRESHHCVSFHIHHNQDEDNQSQGQMARCTCVCGSDHPLSTARYSENTKDNNVHQNLDRLEAYLSPRLKVNSDIRLSFVNKKRCPRKPYR
ncbi:hypothetical protein BC939DRAFT_455791 [Gamsiella multidivaricata]|uniref:uncharacterized protein n=1 Tax=Gamsiella multidivaricata TaxID=101098 RepID=UPI0022211D28|nr:uncharacterized protein BC939DRAFT_455791 [Gamsiella multidivaricata]KAI7821355.1 hypothetical protein BC939DRAFT_455791 [Gamsiella multidivaricata]